MRKNCKPDTKKKAGPKRTRPASSKERGGGNKRRYL